MLSDADLEAMLTAVGGVTVSADGGSFVAVFDNEYIDPSGVETRSPVLMCRESDVSALRKGAVLLIERAKYKVRRTEPDGTGMARVILDN